MKSTESILKPTTISDAGIELIVKSEGLKLKAYLDSANVWTIGIGTTRYYGGNRVRQGDTCTIQQAYEYFRFDIRGACKDVDDLTVDNINQYQFDSLVSFVYNCGRGAYMGSTLRKKVNANPADPKIGAEFLKWVNAGGKFVKGLQLRRQREADHYFTTSAVHSWEPGSGIGDNI